MTVHRKTPSTIAASAAVLLALLASLVACGSGHSRDHGTPDGGPEPRPGRTSAPSGPQTVRLDRRIAEYAAPFSADSGYRQPRPDDRRAIAEAVALVLDGRREQAAQRLSAVGYRLSTLVDATTGHTYAELSDRSTQVPAPRGWGRVYIDLSAPARWSVQVPHPVADLDTERLGARVLLNSPGGVLVIAGAHRDAGRNGAADVAHRRDTVFDAVCDELARRGLPGIQVHGFADDSAPEHDVIASPGIGKAGRPDGRILADALRDRGLRVCRAWVRSCPLEGTQNMQGRRAADDHLPFLHVEFANSVRTDGRRAALAAAAVKTLTDGWAARSGGSG
ncbi:hypothetical protein [Streptomyces sp. CT34]|uniref:hypothetical protein n=1 Tax=Streptomyces sp. CT34 TaxID=1553907 RepID=UPI00068B2339|nr:hypothetical protein [Streptomyces sp. CT34]